MDSKPGPLDPLSQATLDVTVTSRTLSRRTDKWVRSANGKIAGVCGGVAKILDVQPWIVRLLWLVFVFAFGTGILAYAILAYCLPREDRVEEAYRRRILGVCYRVSKQSDYEVGLVRVLAVAFALASFGATIIAYVVMYFVMKEDHPGVTA